MSTSIRPRASQSQTPGPGQRDGSTRAVRLPSIKDRKQSTPFRQDQLSLQLGNERPKPQCKNKECPQSKVEEIEGKLICTNCGYVMQESQITQELTFGEASNGAAIVQGAFVHQDDEVARNPAMAGNRVGGGMSSREQTERNGSHFMNSFLQALRLQQIDKERGMKYFKLAASNNFIQGRITKHVAAVCLYLACRGEEDCKVMLVDFSDIIEVNVFKLGQIYNDLVEALHLQGQDVRGRIFECNPENLIQRFAQDLEFGPDEHRIANEAVQILKRMKRDWIYTGRRPAGVCGAALILAARMNNYRRTVREVVYTAKVADVTINKRLDEFKFTDSSKLTVDEFRHHGVDLEKEHDPPAYYRQFEKKKKRKSSKRKRAAEEEDADDAESDAVSIHSSEAPESARTSAEPGILTQQQQDSRDMPPPAIPIDPQLQDVTSQSAPKRRKTGRNAYEPDEVESADSDDMASATSTMTGKRRAGRPKGSRNKPLPVKTAAAIADEEETERDMLAALDDPANQAEAERVHRSLLPTPPQTQESIPLPAPTVPSATIPESSQPTTSSLDEVALDEHEFEDDPEVRDCLLTPEESAIKEAVWVTNNGNWLKEQQARKIKRELAEKSGTAKVPQKRKRHRKRLGDMSDYSEFQREDGTIGKPRTAAEATTWMLQKRGYSKKLNYLAIGRAYERSPSEGSGSPRSEASSSLLLRPASKRATDMLDSTALDEDSQAYIEEHSPNRVRKMRAPPRKARNITAQAPEQDLYNEERNELVELAEEAAPNNNDDDDEEDDEQEEEEEEDNFSGSGEEYE